MWSPRKSLVAMGQFAAVMPLGMLPAAAIVCIASALACTAANATGPQSSQWSGEKSVRADALIGHFLDRVNANEGGLSKASMALAIGSDRGSEWARGYGESAPGVPATKHTVYHVGSLAKQFTAAAVLDLVGRKSTLRDGTPMTPDLALSRIFEGVEHWPGLDAAIDTQPVTLRSLLTMTSNLPNFTRVPPATTNPWGRIGAPELLSELKKLKPSGWPNTFEYSNTSYFLLAEAIEEAILPGETAPHSHRDVLRKQIFSRAHLTETGFVGDYALGSNLATPIYRRAPVFDQPDWLKGSADIASSAADLYSWNAALMSGRVLPPELFALMVSDGARVTPEIYYGMGWFVEHRAGQDVFSHSGHVPGFTSYNLIAAEPMPGGNPEVPNDRRWTSITLLVNTDVTEGLDSLAEDLLRLARE